MPDDLEYVHWNSDYSRELTQRDLVEMNDGRDLRDELEGMNRRRLGGDSAPATTRDYTMRFSIDVPNSGGP